MSYSCTQNIMDLNDAFLQSRPHGVQNQEVMRSVQGLQDSTILQEVMRSVQGLQDSTILQEAMRSVQGLQDSTILQEVMRSVQGLQDSTILQEAMRSVQDLQDSTILQEAVLTVQETQGSSSFQEAVLAVQEIQNSPSFQEALLAAQEFQKDPTIQEAVLATQEGPPPELDNPLGRSKSGKNRTGSNPDCEKRKQPPLLFAVSGFRKAGSRIKVACRVDCHFCQNPLIVEHESITIDGKYAVVDVSVVPLCSTCMRKAEKDPEYWENCFSPPSERGQRLVLIQGGGKGQKKKSKGMLRLVPKKSS